MKKGYPAWNLSTRSTRKRKRYWTPAVFHGKTLTEEKADIYEQLAQLNKQIRAERQKIKLCREIADSAAVMQREVAAQEKSLHEKETEHSFTNRR